MASLVKTIENEGCPWTNWLKESGFEAQKDGEEDRKPPITKQPESQSMELERKDAHVFGFSPFTETLTLARCELCRQFIKISAFLEHDEKHKRGIPIPVFESMDIAVTSTKRNGQKPCTKKSWKSVAQKNSTHRKITKQVSKPQKKAVPRKGLKTPEQCANSECNGDVSPHKDRPPTTTSMPVVKVERILPGKDKAYKVASSKTPQEEAAATSGSSTAQDLKSANGTVSGTVDDASWRGTALQDVKVTSQHSTVIPPAGPVNTIAVSLPCTSTTTTQATSVRSSAVRAPSYNLTAKPSKELASMLTTNSTYPPVLAPTLFPASHGQTTTTSPATTSIPSSSGKVACAGSVAGTAKAQVSSTGKKKKKERKYLPCKEREFDPDLHCGVMLEDGTPCTRSLTCKTHSLKLQREVLGRSKTLDKLLAERKLAKEAEQKAKMLEKSYVVAASKVVPKSTADLVQSTAAKLKVANAVLSTPVVSSSLPLATVKEEDIKVKVKVEGASPQRSELKKITPGSLLASSLHVSERQPSPASAASSDVIRYKDLINSHPSKSPVKLDNAKEEINLPSLTHSPKPAAVNTFGARSMGKRTVTLNTRKHDNLRAQCAKAFQVETDEPAPKKLCLASSVSLQGQAKVASAVIAAPVCSTGGGLAPQRPAVSFTISSHSNAGAKGRPLLKPSVKPSRFLKVPAVVMASGASGTQQTVMLSIASPRDMTAASIAGTTTPAAAMSTTASVVMSSAGIALPSSVSSTAMSGCLPTTLSYIPMTSETASSSDVLSLPVSISTGGTSSGLTTIDMTGLNIPLSGNITLTGGAQDVLSGVEGSDTGVAAKPTILGVSGSPNTYFVSGIPGLTGVSGVSTPSGATGAASIVGIAGTSVGRRVSAASTSKALAGSSSKTASGLTYPNMSLAAALLEAPIGPASRIAAGNSGGTCSHPAVVSVPTGTSPRLLKRKHSDNSNSGGSGSGDSSPGHIVPSTLQLSGTQWKFKRGPGGVGLLQGANGICLSQTQATTTTLLMPVTTQATTTGLTAVTLPNQAAASTTTTFRQPTQKLNKLKGVNLVLARADNAAAAAALPTQGGGGGGGEGGARFNGQCLNVTATGSQLAQLAAVQAVSATAEDKNIKRNQLAKHGGGGTQLSKLQALRGTAATATANMLRSLPAGTVLVDGSSVQGAVLTPVTLAGGGGATPALLVAQTSGGVGGTLSRHTTVASASSSAAAVRPHAMARTISTCGAAQLGAQIAGTITNGTISSAGESLHTAAGTSQQQRHHPHHHHHQQQKQKAAQQQKAVLSSGKVQKQQMGPTAAAVTATKTLQVTGFAQPQATPICPTPNSSQVTHFSIQGGRVQTIPVISSMPSAVSQPLLSSSHTIPQPQALLVTSAAAADGNSAGGTAGGGGIPAEFLQPSISNASRAMS